MRIQIATFAVTMALAFVALGEDVTVTVKRIVETRETPSEKRGADWSQNGIELTLHLEGPSIVGARKVAEWNITKAIDDRGTDLARPEERFFVSGYIVPKRGQSGGPDQQGADRPRGVDVELKLGHASARDAKLITQLSGTVQIVVGGEKKLIEVKQIRQNAGKTIDDPALKALGVTIALADPSVPQPIPALFMNEDPNARIPIVLSGNVDSIAELRVVDGSGNEVNRSSMSNDDGGKRLTLVSLEKPITDDMKLQIEIWPGQKTITVPIELKDLKLP